MPNFVAWGTFTSPMQFAVNSRQQLLSLTTGSGIEARTMAPAHWG